MDKEIDNLYHDLNIKIPIDIIENINDLYINENVNYPYSRNKTLSRQLTPELLLSINNLFNSNLKIRIIDAGIYKTPKNMTYNWHVDARRNCRINVQLTNIIDGQFTLFADSKSEAYPVFYNTHNVIYRQYYLMLFNTAILHSVINISNESRYILSFGIENYTYKHILSLFKSNILFNLNYLK